MNAANMLLYMHVHLYYEQLYYNPPSFRGAPHTRSHSDISDISSEISAIISSSLTTSTLRMTTSLPIKWPNLSFLGGDLPSHSSSSESASDIESQSSEMEIIDRACLMVRPDTIGLTDGAQGASSGTIVASGKDSEDG